VSLKALRTRAGSRPAGTTSNVNSMPVVASIFTSVGTLGSEQARGPNPEFQRLNVRREATQRVACGPFGPSLRSLCGPACREQPGNRRERPSKIPVFSRLSPTFATRFQFLNLRLFIGETGSIWPRSSVFWGLAAVCGRLARRAHAQRPAMHARCTSYREGWRNQRPPGPARQETGCSGSPSGLWFF